jgi:SAM-dependent methyltransferase
MRREDALWYDQLYDGIANRGYALRARMATVLRLAGSGPGDALDVGMGPGRLCSELDRVGWTISGVDTSNEMIELARCRLPRASAHLLRASADELPFDDDSFDLVTAIGVLEYAGVPRALHELSRVLRPGGRAILSYPVRGSLYSSWKTRVYYPAARSAKRVLGYEGRPQNAGAPVVAPQRLCELLVDVGLAPKRVVPTCYLALPSPLDELMPTAQEWLGRRLESHRVASRRFATQLVVETTGLEDPLTFDHASRGELAVREVL